jgi:hypothetical protein
MSSSMKRTRRLASLLEPRVLAPIIAAAHPRMLGDARDVDASHPTRASLAIGASLRSRRLSGFRRAEH